MNKRLAERLEVMKMILALLKEVFFVAIFVLLIFSPLTMRSILVNAGIQSFAGIEFRGDLEQTNRETRDAIGEVTALRDSLEQLQEKLETAIAGADEGRARSELQEIQKTVSSTTMKAYEADNNLKRSFSRQQSIIQQIDPQAITQEGWIFLGKIGHSGGWAERPKTVDNADWPLQLDDMLRVRTDVYLRADSEGQHSAAEPLSVAKVGQVVEVMEVDSSSAKGGGWFIWAKVRVLE